MSYHSRLVETANKAALVYFVTAQAEDSPAWYYVQVEEPKHAAFRKQIAATGELDLKHFGKVLFSGWGETPPEPIEALVKESFAQ